MKQYAVYIKVFVIIFLTGTTIYPSVFAQNTENTFSVEDYLTMTRIGGPTFSPDGQWIVYTLGKKEKWDGKRSTNIWLKKSDNSQSVQLTNHEKGSYSPKWSPDSKQIAFLTSRSGKMQVYVIAVSGGEAMKATSAENGISNFYWIGNDAIVYSSDEPRDSTIVASEKKAGGAYIVGTEDHTSALWLQKIGEETPKKITNGSYYINEFAVSVDGKLFCLVVSSNSHMYTHLVEGKVILINEKGEELFSFKDAHTLANPTVSPDGKKASWVGCTTGYSENNGLYVVDVASKSVKNLTKEFDPTIGQIQWLDNNAIAFKTPRNVTDGIYSASVSSGEIKPLLKPHFGIGSFSIHAKSKKISFTGETSNKPKELIVATVGAEPAKAQYFTDYNDWVTKKNLAKTKVIQYKSYDDFQIEAVLHLPLDYKEGNKYPLMVLPHGGPDGIVQDKFRLFGQLFAKEGLIVFEPNFRGGIGYGSELYQANRGRLGDVDYKDIMWGVNHLIAKGMVDSTKMVVGGWSYGGYMTNWVIGHTNRFKAAVCVAGIANTVSMYAQSDINHGDIANWEFKGVPVKNMENFHRSSPLESLINCTTPTLYLHGEADTRVPVAQAWEGYRALEDLGVETKMVLYPGASHGIRAPKQFVNVMESWTSWYKAHLD
ncbi:MAG: hypothetical protein COA57_03850 [Flavobacteriales bacterium]|nr:S9 family peptidase [Bacteroidales bacterium AH-315-I05]PCJ88101.1 MAG: hypothetical protein COA57_03850 [Flavobacteriales bacterium]